MKPPRLRGRRPPAAGKGLVLRPPVALLLVAGTALVAPCCAQNFIGTGFHVDDLFFCASKLRNGLLP